MPRLSAGSKGSEGASGCLAWRAATVAESGVRSLSFEVRMFSAARISPSFTFELILADILSGSGSWSSLLVLFLFSEDLAGVGEGSDKESSARISVMVSGLLIFL